MMCDMEKKKLAVIGNGYLAGILAQAWEKGLLESYRFVGVLGRSREKTEALARRLGCRACFALGDLMEEEPDYVVEVASVEAVKSCGEAVLSGGADLLVLSIGAFADPSFYEKMERCAAANKRRIHILSGAVGGFDVLRTVSLMSAAGAGDLRARMRTEKGPTSLKGTPLFEEKLMGEGDKTQVFSGSAKEAIGLLPTKVNVAVAASLATAGPEHTHFEIYSVPGMKGDDHRIEAEAEDVRAVVDIYSQTAAIAAWSAVARLRNLASPVVF